MPVIDETETTGREGSGGSGPERPCGAGEHLKKRWLSACQRLTQSDDAVPVRARTMVGKRRRFQFE